MCARQRIQFMHSDHRGNAYIQNTYLTHLYNDVQYESNVCTYIKKRKRQNLLYSYSGNRIRFKMWSSKSSSIWHQGWMLCWKSPARKLHFTCFQHFFPRLNNNNHFTNNQMTRYIELLYWCVMIQQGDKIFCFPVTFKSYL